MTFSEGKHKKKTGAVVKTGLLEIDCHETLKTKQILPNIHNLVLARSYINVMFLTRLHLAFFVSFEKMTQLYIYNPGQNLLRQELKIQ